MLLASALILLAKVYLTIFVVTILAIVSNEREKFYSLAGIEELFRDIDVGDESLADKIPIITFILSMFYHVVKYLINLIKFLITRWACAIASSIPFVDLGCESIEFEEP